MAYIGVALKRKTLPNWAREGQENKHKKCPGLSGAEVDLRCELWYNQQPRPRLLRCLEIFHGAKERKFYTERKKSISLRGQLKKNRGRQMERILDFMAHGITSTQPTFRPFSSCASVFRSQRLKCPSCSRCIFPRYKNKRAERDLNCIDDHKRWFWISTMVRLKSRMEWKFSSGQPYQVH